MTYKQAVVCPNTYTFTIGCAAWATEQEVANSVNFQLTDLQLYDTDLTQKEIEKHFDWETSKSSTYRKLKECTWSDATLQQNKQKEMKKLREKYIYSNLKKKWMKKIYFKESQWDIWNSGQE